MRTAARSAVVVFCLLVPPIVIAGGLPDSFTLGRYVPEDVWLFAQVAKNPERAWLDEQWQRVLDAVQASGVDQDIAALMQLPLGDRGHTQRWTALIKDVRWADLVAVEAAVGERFRAGPHLVEYFLLARGKPGTAQANMKRLMALVKAFAAESETIELAKRNLNGVGVLSLVIDDSPFTFSLFRKGDLIGLVVGDEAINEVTALLATDGKKRSILTSPRFLEALAQVPEPEDSVAFFDFKLLHGNLSSLMSSFAAQVKPGQDDQGLAPTILSLGKKILELSDFSDYGILTVETQGRRQLTHGVTRIRQGKERGPLARCWLERAPFERFDRFIPLGATSYSINGGLDLEKLYDIAIGFMDNELPGGQKYAARLREKFTSLGFDPKRDLFSWWSGEMISVTLPPGVFTPMGGDDWALIFRVKDGDLASRKVNAALDFLIAWSEARGEMLTVSPAQVNAAGFRRIMHPMAMMIVCPVIGVKDNWLIVGSSSATINKCLDVASGKAPSIRDNKRFMKEGLVPKGAVLSASFKDTSNSGKELGELAVLVGMASGTAAAQLPQRPKTNALRQVLQRVQAISMKIVPVLHGIDFYRSEAIVTTYERPLLVRTEKVVTYKPLTSGRGKTDGGK